VKETGFSSLFLWVNKEGVLKIFRHAQVAFGVTSSPFFLVAVIDFHLKKYSEVSEETTAYTRSITEKLRNRLYVHNCATNLENERVFHLFIKEDYLVFSEAKFDLRGSIRNPACKILTVLWCWAGHEIGRWAH